MKYCILLTLIILFAGCGQEKSYSGVNAHLFPAASSENKKAISKHSIEIEKIVLDDPEPFEEGTFELFRDTLLYIEKRKSTIYRFDAEGCYIDKKLGWGESPWEVNFGPVSGYTLEPDGSWIFLGSMVDFNFYSSQYERMKRVRSDWARTDTLEYDHPNIYSCFYENQQMVRVGDNEMYYSITIQHPLLNAFVAPSFYRKVRTWCKVNIHSGETLGITGGYPPIYSSRKNLDVYSFFYVDKNKSNDLYITYDADSLIYYYDKNMDPICFWL